MFLLRRYLDIPVYFWDILATAAVTNDGFSIVNAPPSCAALDLLVRVTILGMGVNVWICPLGPITPEDVNWMHFPDAAAALHYLHSLLGGSPTKLHHTYHTTVL